MEPVRKNAPNFNTMVKRDTAMDKEAQPRMPSLEMRSVIPDIEKIKPDENMHVFAGGKKNAAPKRGKRQQTIIKHPEIIVPVLNNGERVPSICYLYRNNAQGIIRKTGIPQAMHDRYGLVQADPSPAIHGHRRRTPQFAQFMFDLQKRAAMNAAHQGKINGALGVLAGLIIFKGHGVYLGLLPLTDIIIQQAIAHPVILAHGSSPGLEGIQPAARTRHAVACPIFKSLHA